MVLTRLIKRDHIGAFSQFVRDKRLTVRQALGEKLLPTSASNYYLSLVIAEQARHRPCHCTLILGNPKVCGFRCLTIVINYNFDNCF